jgi:hypothetical protein
MDAAGFIPGRRGVVDSWTPEGSLLVMGESGLLTLSAATARNLFVAA